jgi:hypothetical protein
MGEWLATCLIIAVGGFLFIRWTLKADQKAFAALERLLPADLDYEFCGLGDVTGEVLGEFDDTAVISTVVADDVAYGVHSWRRVIVRLEPYRGTHHMSIGRITVAQLQARSGVSA